MEIPQTDSIQELAQFWDSHDVTDFEDQLEIVTTTVFESEAVVGGEDRFSESAAPFTKQLIAQNRDLFEELARR